MSSVIKITAVFLIFFLTVKCEPDYSSMYPYVVPSVVDDGIKVGSLDEVGMNKELISKAVGRIDNGKYGEIHSMLVYKNNKLVIEE